MIWPVTIVLLLVFRLITPETAFAPELVFPAEVGLMMIPPKAVGALKVFELELLAPLLLNVSDKAQL